MVHLNIIVGHLNINSLNNKSQALQYVINRNLDITLLLKIKVDDSFPSVQFMLQSYGISYRLDRNSNGGGLLLYGRKDILCKFLQVKSDCHIESIRVEINLKKTVGSLMTHTILVKPLYQTILSVLITSQMNKAKRIKISCFWETLIPR